MRRWVLVVPFMFFACSGSQQPTATVAVSSPVPDPDPASAPSPPVDAGSIDPPPPVGDVPDAGMPADPPPQKSCMAAQGGSDKLLVGADMTDGVAEQARFDIRYLYLAGGLGTGSCSNSPEWWGCWQDLSQPPGQYLRDLLGKTKLPMVSYYELLQTSGVAEGKPEVAALTNGTLLKRYFDDWRFVLQQIGQGPALLHIEPDLWGYAQQANSNPHALPAAVTSANPADCSAQENSVAGFAKCLIAMVRKYAPHAKVGLHASAWASGIDGTSNSNPSVDMAAEARKVADYLLALGGGDGDFVVVEASDRDAGWYQAQGAGNAFWDPANTTLPTFHQAFSWVTALTERMNKPALWWQLPLGNMSLPNVNLQWQDNRVDYFFTHTDEVARTNAFAMVFGAGEDHQTNPSTDNGNFVKRVLALTAAGGQPVCP
ncbi:MAG: hypothetical protein ABR567_19655 [Myxococcales bacterium]